MIGMCSAFSSTTRSCRLEEITRLSALQGAELRQAKEVLAFEATKLTHGEDEARQARGAAHAAV